MAEFTLESVGLCTAEEAARMKDKAVRTVQRWIEDGDIPAAVIGSGRYKKYLLKIKDVEAFTPAPRGAPPGNQNAAKAPDPKKSAAKKTKAK